MDLSLKDFTNSFLSTEVSKVELKSMNGGSIYLRSLSRANVLRVQKLYERISGRMYGNMFKDKPELLKIKNEELIAGEDLLVIKTLCDSEGKLLFKSIEEYSEWSEDVSNVVIDEIIHNINEKMNIFYDAEKEAEELEKKKKS